MGRRKRGKEDGWNGGRVGWRKGTEMEDMLVVFQYCLPNRQGSKFHEKKEVLAFTCSELRPFKLSGSPCDCT